MNFVASVCIFALSLCVSGMGGILLGFVWYERRCGLLSDPKGKQAAAIRFELDDVFGRSSVPTRKSV